LADRLRNRNALHASNSIAEDVEKSDSSIRADDLEVLGGAQVGEGFCPDLVTDAEDGGGEHRFGEVTSLAIWLDCDGDRSQLRVDDVGVDLVSEFAWELQEAGLDLVLLGLRAC